VSDLELVADPRAAGGAAIRTAGVTGLGTALPANPVGNEDLAPRLGVDPAWIERRTGIRARRHATTETLEDLATGAAAAALADAGVSADDVELVLVATCTAEDRLPNVAPVVAHALGSRAAAIDVGAACTGFLSAAALGAAAIEARRAETVLVIGAEVLSRFIDLDDRRTAGLFGDGAGAAVLAAGAGHVGPVVLRSAGEHRELITNRRSHEVIRMDGHETFLVAVASLEEATLEACRRAGVGVGDVDLFVFHQANRRILTAVAERLELAPGRVLDAIADVGNTSAASLPLALARARDGGLLWPGARVLVGAMGAGFTYGAALLRWGPA
jgi:3-oxoacyl-[acyl-carrier-protein] synthase III